jgi:hypothetical protein
VKLVEKKLREKSITRFGQGLKADFGGAEMVCRYLKCSSPKRCLATEEFIVPSVLEALVFCYSEPEECQLYKIREKSIFKKPVKNSLTIEQDRWLKEVHRG